MRYRDDPPGYGWSYDPEREARNRRRRRIGIGAGIVGGTLLLAFAWLWFGPCWAGGCGPVSDLERFQPQGSVLLDVRGETFATLATVNRRAVPLDSLPPHLPRAFLAIEDQRFRDHQGVDWRRLAGAMVENVRAGGVAEGGSTLSMQLARNLFPDFLPYTERSVRRKILEVRVARQIERALPKDRILEMYLNHIYLGAGAYGVEAAAREYFGRPAAELSISQAATLAALPKAPSQLNPRENPEGARRRRDLVLRQMVDAGYLSPGEADAILGSPIRLAPDLDPDAEAESGAYFVERVRRELEQQMGDRFYTAGLRVHTTFDPRIQAAAEEELEAQLRRIETGRFGAFRHPAYGDDGSGDGGAAEAGGTPYLQGMAMVMEAEGGEVRALVGGRDFRDSRFDRATQALRQPGSAWKPFVYLTALQRSRAPTYSLEDAPVRLVLAGGQTWEPRNYTGRYDGPMTLREALARSKNAVTVRLAEELGMRSIIRTARELGISTPIPDLPSTALGAAEVRPIELVSAYAAFANGGMRVEPVFIRRIEDRDGIPIWEATSERERVIDPAVAFVLTDMLRDVVDRGTATSVREAGFRGPAAGKTGTTNAATDVWFVGFTPDLVGGVWIGFDQPRTIVRGASGGTLAAPVWARLMSRVYAERPAPHPWRPPAGVVTEEVERATGWVVGEWCPPQGPTYTEYFVNVRPPRRVCGMDPHLPTYVDDPAWLDEEWGTVDSLPSPGGVVWPELESLREEDRLP